MKQKLSLYALLHLKREMRSSKNVSLFYLYFIVFQQIRNFKFPAKQPSLLAPFPPKVINIFRVPEVVSSAL